MQSPKIKNKESALEVYTRTLREIFHNANIDIQIEHNTKNNTDLTVFNFLNSDKDHVAYFVYSCNPFDDETILHEGIKDKEKFPKDLKFIKLMLIYAILQCEKPRIELQAWGSDPFYRFEGKKEERKDSGASLIAYYETLGFDVIPDQNIKIDENGKFGPVSMVSTRKKIRDFILKDNMIRRCLGRVMEYLRSI